MLSIFLLQVGLPIALLGWLLAKPPKDGFNLFLHLAAALLILIALLLAGLWTILPWWLPWLYTAMLLLALSSLRRRKPEWRLPEGGGWVRAVTLVSVSALGAWFAASATAGRRMPPSPPEILGWPLESGEVMVANGGATLTVNGHSETLDLSVPRHRAWTGQSYGVDLVGLTNWGRSTGGLLPSDPSRYAIWGRTVRSPCTGRVMWARGDVRDNAVPFVPRDADPGNFVLLRCGRADVLLAHFRRGSLAVQAGQRVRKGQALAEVGNSGASSEPHLHIHAQTAGSKAAPFSGRPLPVLLGGRWLVRNDRVGP